MEIYDWLLRRVSKKTGVAVGYLNYLISQGLALLLATLFRKPPLRGRSPTLRLWTCLLLGLGLGYYNLGKSSIHLVVLPTLLFCSLKNTPLCYAGHSSLCVSMLYLWFVDLNCLSYCLERKCLIGYLMSICQKASSLGYCLQDRALGREVNPRLSGRTNFPRDWFDVIPSAPKYFSYLLEFISLPYGPPVFYAEYMNFLEETDFKDLAKDGRSLPSPICAVFCKLSTALLLLTINVYLVKYYSIFYLAQMHSPASEINDWSPLYLMWYAYLACTVQRMAYYIAFLMTELVCNNSGMGFRFNSAGMFRWDGLTNSDVIGHELGASWRVAVASWNTRTHAWLHGVAYARGSRRWRTVRAYTLSTLWHGASPGYACTFYTGIMFNLASKKVHMVLRPKFLGSRSKKLFYDLLSIVLTRVALTYSTLPFMMMHLAPTLAFYGKFYYSLHFIAIGISLIPENLKINWSYQSMLPWKSCKVKDL